jgi:MFS family permease
MSATEYGFLSSTYLFADVILLLPAGIILDRFSTRKVILSALALCILGTVGFAYSYQLWTACFFHFLSGIGNAFCFLSCMMLVAKWFPAERHAYVMGMVVTIGMLGGVIAQTPFTLLTQMFDWRSALLIDALVGTAIFALIYAFVEDQPKNYVSKGSVGSTYSFWGGIKYAICNRQNILCGMYTGLMNLPVMLLGAMWGSLYLVQIHHLNLSEASLVAGLICTGTIVGSPFFGYVADRMQTKRPLMIAGAILSICVISLLMSSLNLSFAALSALFFLVGFFTSTQVLGYPLITDSSVKELTGTSMGVAAVIIMGLAAIAQPLSGMLIDMNWNGAFLDQIPQYSRSDYLHLFWIFPVGFLISLVTAYSLKEAGNEFEYDYVPRV